MVIAEVAVSGVQVQCISCEKIPRGIIGAQIHVTCEDPVWEPLQKTVVFRGAETKAVVNAGEWVTIPAEVVSKSGAELWVGVCGTDAQGTVVIPTLWAELGTVWGSAHPSGDSTTDPTLPVWAQIQAQIGDPQALLTEKRESLVAAVNELAQRETGGGSLDMAAVEQCIADYLTENPPADGEDGADGKDGADGVSPVISVAEISGGHRVTITDVGGTKSMDVLDGAAGQAGADGADGYTPVRGTDYWTQEDKTQIVQEVIAALGTPVFGTVDAENTITLSGVLAEGTYTLQYENEDGSLTQIGSITIGSGVTYTNLADPASEDWVLNSRINSSGNLTQVSDSQRGDQTMVMTNYIPTAGVEAFHYKGIDVTSALTASGENYSRFYFYDSEKAYLGYYQCSNRLAADFSAAEYDDTVMICDYTSFSAAVSTAASASYVRFGGILTEDTVIITADEEIQ